MTFKALMTTLALTTTLASPTLADGPSSFTEMAADGAAASLTAPPIERLTKAAPAYYLDQAAFDAAAPGLVSEDFSSSTATAGAVIGCGNPVSDGNACFEPGGLAAGLVIAASTATAQVVALGSGFVDNTTPMVAADRFGDSTFVEFTLTDVTAVGLRLAVVGAAQDMQISIEGIDGTTLDVMTIRVDQSLSFWGVVSPAPIGRIALQSVNRAGEVIDRVQFGEATTDTTIEDFENGTIDSAWTLTGIGHANQVETLVVDFGSDHEMALTADGATAYLGADNAGFLYQELTGDFRIEADVDTSPMTTGKAWRKAGLMVRASLDDLDIRLLVMQAPVQGRLQFVARETYGGPGNVKVAFEEAAPSAVRLAIERVGQVLSVEYSLDGGATWIVPTTGLGGSIDIAALPPTLYVGLAALSNNISVSSTVLYDNVSIRHDAP